MIDLDEFIRRIELVGWAMLPAAVPEPLIAKMADDLSFAYRACRAAQERNGVADATRGTVHHLPALRKSYLEFLEMNPAAPYVERYFGGPYILNSFGGNFNGPEDASYAGKVHRDVRTYQRTRMLLNTLVMLDDFTEENGATWLLPRGHLREERPADDYFRLEAVQAIGPAGSILLWDSNLWHAAGENRTNKMRRSVTPMFSKPWFKPGFDYPRALGYDAVFASETLRQVLGYNARIPATLDEWYQPPATRFYQGHQG